MSLPLLTGACASGNGLGLEASDPSCVLLCALTRTLTGESPKPQSVPIKPAVVTAKHSARPVQPANQKVLHRPHRTAAAPVHRSRPSQIRSVPAAEPVVSPPASGTSQAVPAPQTTPTRQAAPVIPGSATIMPSSIQGQ